MRPIRLPDIDPGLDHDLAKKLLAGGIWNSRRLARTDIVETDIDAMDPCMESRWSVGCLHRIFLWHARHVMFTESTSNAAKRKPEAPPKANNTLRQKTMSWMTQNGGFQRG